MPVIRAAKVLLVAAIAVFASLVAFGNLTDYNTNFAFVEHVLSMDTILPFSRIQYRAITSPQLHHIAYAIIIAAEATTGAGDGGFNRAKSFAIAGLTLGFLLWQVGFMSIGGERFGMWQSQQWNGVEGAFRIVITIAVVLIFVAMPD